MDGLVNKLEKVSILMIEDRQIYYELFKTTIVEEWPNAQITFANSGASAKKIINEGIPSEYHLVILDLGLPDCNGEDLIKVFRDHEKLRATPILVLTGDSDESTQSRLLQMGANDFCAKGSSPDLFLARLQIQLHNKLTLDQLTQKALNMEMFTTGVLHDIRNIETTVIALCELVEMKLKKEPSLQKQSLLGDIASLKSQTYRINEYASSILQKVRSSHHPYNPELVSIEGVMKWVENVIANQDNFKWHLHNSRPIQPVYCDGSMLKLVLFNICQNSVKYQEDGLPCEIHIYQGEQQSGDPMITTYIEDNGPGLPEEDSYARIFLPFQRAKGHEKREGFGLGLALVAKVIGNMQGEVWAEPASRFNDHGLRIGLRLPQKKTGA